MAHSPASYDPARAAAEGQAGAGSAQSPDIRLPGVTHAITNTKQGSLDSTVARMHRNQRQPK